MNRFNSYTATPRLAQLMMDLSAALSKCECVPLALRHLLECRVSQLNGCAYCLRMHVKSYLESEGAPKKLYMLPLWRSAEGFSGAERAALNWAEHLTASAPPETLSRVHLELQAFYDLEQVSTLTFIVSTINAWNRLGIAQHSLA